MRLIDFNLTSMLRVKNTIVCHLEYFHEKVVEICNINEGSDLINEEKQQLLPNLHLLFLGDCSHASPLSSLIKSSSVSQIHSQTIKIQFQTKF